MKNFILYVSLLYFGGYIDMHTFLLLFYLNVFNADEFSLNDCISSIDGIDHNVTKSNNKCTRTYKYLNLLNQYI